MFFFSVYSEPELEHINLWSSVCKGNGAFCLAEADDAAAPFVWGVNPTLNEK